MAAFNRVTLIVLDSAGIGALPDAEKFGDIGVNTVGNTARLVGGLNLPNMQKLGFGNITEILGVPPVASPEGAYGRMAEVSNGKDTTTGHWEIAGIILEQAFRTYPNGFPKELIEEFQKRIGRKTLGNKVASGTAIIDELGPEHMRTGYPIVYTSADSVFQVAAHEEIIPLEELYRICKIAREMLVGEYTVGRVIARPFIGRPGSFKRTPNRHDYSLKPPGKTILDYLKEKGLEVLSIGKIKDIFDGEGITKSVSIKSNDDGMDKVVESLKEPSKGLTFANLVDFDSLYGHRNDAQGYAHALEDFDKRLPEVLSMIKKGEILIITADHGCDPTTEGTDHTREYVPLLVYGPDIKAGTNLGTRKTFADIAATIAEIFEIEFHVGTSFLRDITK